MPSCALCFTVLVAFNDSLSLGITPGSLDLIRTTVLAFAGVEGVRDVAEAWRVTRPDHDVVDTAGDGYDPV